MFFIVHATVPHTYAGNINLVIFSLLLCWFPKVFVRSGHNI